MTQGSPQRQQEYEGKLIHKVEGTSLKWGKVDKKGCLN